MHATPSEDRHSLRRTCSPSLVHPFFAFAQPHLGIVRGHFTPFEGRKLWCMQDWKDPREFYGCGKFVSDSWRIFCRGERSTQGVEDINLLDFLWSLNTGSFVDPNPRQLRSLTRQLEGEAD